MKEKTVLDAKSRTDSFELEKLYEWETSSREAFWDPEPAKLGGQGLGEKILSSALALWSVSGW